MDGPTACSLTCSAWGGGGGSRLILKTLASQKKNFAIHENPNPLRGVEGGGAKYASTCNFNFSFHMLRKNWGQTPR